MRRVRTDGRVLVCVRNHTRACVCVGRTNGQVGRCIGGTSVRACACACVRAPPHAADSRGSSVAVVGTSGAVAAPAGRPCCAGEGGCGKRVKGI